MGLAEIDEAGAVEKQPVGTTGDELAALGFGKRSWRYSMLVEDGVIVEEGTLVRLPGHQPKLSSAQEQDAKSYLRVLESEPYAPPTDVPIDSEVLNLLADQGRVVRVSESVVFESSAYQRMVDRILDYTRERGEVTVADVRDMFGASRKYALAIMDYLDHQRVTRRVGDVRVLR